MKRIKRIRCFSISLVVLDDINSYIWKFVFGIMVTYEKDAVVVAKYGEGLSEAVLMNISDVKVIVAEDRSRPCWLGYNGISVPLVMNKNSGRWELKDGGIIDKDVCYRGPFLESALVSDLTLVEENSLVRALDCFCSVCNS